MSFTTSAKPLRARPPSVSPMLSGATTYPSAPAAEDLLNFKGRVIEIREDHGSAGSRQITLKVVIDAPETKEDWEALERMREMPIGFKLLEDEPISSSSSGPAAADESPTPAGVETQGEDTGSW